MPSAVSPERTDMATSGSTFSYAQAAKGKSSTSSTASGSIKLNTEDSESTVKMDSSSEETKDFKQTGGAQPISVDDAAESVSSSQSRSQAKSSETSTEQSISKGSDAAQRKPSTTVSSTAEGVSTMPLNGAETVSHTESGDVTPSAKDEETSAAANDSESTWDKVSQESHSEEKPVNKSEGDGDDSKLDSWEHVAQPAQQAEPAQPIPLKEAPPPSINIWQKRQADFQKNKPSQGDKGHVSSQRGTQDSTDPEKADPRKRLQTERGSREDKMTSSEGKSSEAKGRANEEGSNRGARSPGNVKSSTAPPPSSDAISWPTPDLAKDEDKKKSQDRSDKGDTDKTTSKPHGKKEWKTIPYVPSAVFTTPMPQNNRRGGRPRGGRDGGGRGGNHTMNGNVGGDKAPSGSVATSTTTATGSVDRTRGDMGTPKPGQFPSKSKRASSAGPSSSREQRRTGDVVVDETAPKSAPRNTGMDNRRVSSSTQTDGAGQGSPSSRRQQEYSKDDRPQSGISGRREGGPRAGDSSREPNNLPQARERGEGRPDRGRGGYRGGRGGHNGFSGHGFNGQTMPNGYGAAQMSQGFPPSKSQSYSEQRYGSQPQTPSYGPREGKHYRNGSRSQPIPNPPSFGRYPSNGPMAAPHGLPHLQTDAANGFYQPPGVMSAMPFNMIMEQAQLASMIQMQMEYYFSLENLVRDTYLRKHMDSQGFVLLSFILNFNRIKQLTTDAELVRAACWRSPIIEFQQGVEDGKDRIRPMREWQNWVLPMQERAPEAQHDGPTSVQTPQLQYAPNQMFPGPMPPMGASSPASQGGLQYSPEHGSVNGGHPVPPHNGDGTITQTPLSAAVPDFTPSMPSMLPSHSESAINSTADSTFPDEQIGSLTIVVKKELSEPSGVESPPAATRTFSNGSLDPHAISDDVSGLRLSDQPTGGTTNGDPAPESHSQDVMARSRSPVARQAPSRQSSGQVPPPVFWVKGKESPIEGLPPNLVAESYVIYREKALAQRQSSSVERANYDMDVLYQFWSHFLIRNFNTSMYEEFRRFALEDDLARTTTVGLDNLVAFYDASILGQKVISDNLAYDFVDMAKSDHESDKTERPAFQKLRSALRNGALPLRNRIKVDKLFSTELKAALDG